MISLQFGGHRVSKGNNIAGQLDQIFFLSGGQQPIERNLYSISLSYS